MRCSEEAGRNQLGTLTSQKPLTTQLTQLTKSSRSTDLSQLPRCVVPPKGLGLGLTEVTIPSRLWDN